MKPKHRAVINSEDMDDFQSGQVGRLPQDAVHRFLKVLRLPAGEAVELLDGSGRLVVGKLFEGSDGWGLQDARVEAAPLQNAPMLLVQAMIRPAKLEPLVQKATEMGLTELILWQAERSEIKTNAAQFAKKRARLEKIALDAARQSGRRFAPVIHGPYTVSELEGHLVGPQKTLFVGDLEAEKWISQCFQSIKTSDTAEFGLVVGPEGGLTPQEIGFFEGLGATGVRLSPHVLRTETAAFPFLCALQWHRGRL